jgi:hypothetical protein
MMPVSDRLLPEKEYKDYPFCADIYRDYGFTLEQINATKRRAFICAFKICQSLKPRSGKGKEQS